MLNRINGPTDIKKLYKIVRKILFGNYLFSVYLPYPILKFTLKRLKSVADSILPQKGLKE